MHKVKIFYGALGMRLMGNVMSLEEMEKAVNEFITQVDVIDLKYQAAEAMFSVLVHYKEK